MNKRVILIIAIVLLISLGIVGYFVGIPFYYEARLKTISGQIDEIKGVEASAIDSCHSIGLGVKPCGGPWGHIIYSEESTDVERLKELVEEYNEVNRDKNRALRLGSDCALVTPPDITLKNDSCLFAGRVLGRVSILSSPGPPRELVGGNVTASVRVDARYADFDIINASVRVLSCSDNLLPEFSSPTINVTPMSENIFRIVLLDDDLETEDNFIYCRFVLEGFRVTDEIVEPITILSGSLMNFRRW